jgi:hypothetical protein
MSEKNRWIILVALSVLFAGGVSAMIYLQNKQIQGWHADADALRTKIAQERALTKKTPDLVKEVIIQRETDAIIKEILSAEEDINNLVRTLQEFEYESGISITSLKKQKATKSRRGKEDFDRVGYTLSFEASAFELLAFLDLVESHSRFMSVAAFKLTGARRQAYDGGEEPRHRVQLDVETYVYKPKEGTREVRIDGYDRKRDLLVSEISKRTSDLRVPTYEYRGAGGRRDPWVDPRVPISQDGLPVLSIEEQIAIVDELVVQAEAAEVLWEHAAEADNLIAEMKARAQLEEKIALVEEAARRVESEGQLVFVPARNRFDKQVMERLLKLRGQLDSTQGGLGPSLAELQESVDTMQRYIQGQEYELALEAFNAMESRLAAIPERDHGRRSFVQGLNELKRLAEIVLDFEAITIDISGVAILEDRRPVALINGQAVAEGELLSDDLIVRNIRRNQIEFAYRGLVLARPVESEWHGPQPNNARSNQR